MNLHNMPISNNTSYVSICRFNLQTTAKLCLFQYILAFNIITGKG